MAVLQGIIVFAISFAFGFRIHSFGLFLEAFVFMSLVALIFTALGTAIASVLEDMHGFQLIMNFLVMPIFFLSGALFPLAGLPKVLKTIVMFDPMSYGVDGLRGTLGGISQFGLFTDFWILSVIVVVLISVGSYVFSKIQV